MKLPTRLEGLVRIEPRVFRDGRGAFAETWSRAAFQADGINRDFPLEAQSVSVKGTIRGLHFAEPPEAKVVRVVHGAIWDVAVDLRPDSATFGQWEAFELTADNFQQVYLPEGFAHGFAVLSETATVLYKLSRVYDPATPRSLKWNDPDLAIAWPIQPDEDLLSARDRSAPSFEEWKRSASSRR